MIPLRSLGLAAALLASLAQGSLIQAAAAADKPVVAITANTRDMQAGLNIVWDKLLPAFQKEALPDDAATQAKLKEKFANLSVPENHVPVTIKLPGRK